MKCLILFLFCGVLGELPVPTVLPILEPETLTDLPRSDVGEFDVATGQSRQNEVEGDLGVEMVDEPTDVPEVDEDPSSTTFATTTAHFTELACSGSHMEWNSCGPRCYQTCAFQPRGRRSSRAVCEMASLSGCHAGCFCASGYVRLNDKCVLPVDCPSEF